jgi:hypothetical protein
MSLSKKKRIAMAGIGLILGIILCLGKEYFIGGVVIIVSTLGGLNIGTSKKDKLAWFLIGFLFLSGAILTFIRPGWITSPLVSVDLSNSFIIFARFFLIAVAIFMFLQGMK